MQGNEILRLIYWLKEHGFSSDEILNCIEYIESKEPKTEK